MARWNTRPPTTQEWRIFLYFAHRNRTDIMQCASAGNTVAGTIIYLLDNRPSNRELLPRWRDSLSYNVARLMLALWEAQS